ncbi:hypothetical protein [Sporolituus thermophilus]|uniref:Uncharacterized protein n=1 Tax=Sporolituus thermophilus DSM 23256 TaxID=1123285 RepID=A0A1G7MTU9_9FIRM|nr:hypothetical protein [Sporolituus thermophilus]SDF65076.1 hypothetical protein SAMN05660235_02299 [Sporolituus thermophilus DSM 23256]
MQLQGLPCANHRYFGQAHDAYAVAYNALVDKMEAAGLDHKELVKVIHLAVQRERLSVLHLAETVAAWLKGEKPRPGY